MRHLTREVDQGGVWGKTILTLIDTLSNVSMPIKKPLLMVPTAAAKKPKKPMFLSPFIHFNPDKTCQ